MIYNFYVQAAAIQFPGVYMQAVEDVYFLIEDKHESRFSVSSWVKLDSFSDDYA